MPHKGIQSHAPIQSSAKANCEAGGGVWDEQTQTCIPKKTEEKPSPPQTQDPVLELAREKGLSLRSAADILASRQAQSPKKQLLRQSITTQNVEAQQAEEAAGAELRVAALEGERPVRRELDPQLEEGEDFPVFGPLLVKIRNTLRKIEPLSIFEDDSIVDFQPEELRTLALSEIEKREIERGLTDSEKFGSFIEALNVGELKKYIPGAAGAELPSQNVQTVLKSLRVLKSRSIDIELKFQKGLLSRSAANERIALIENELQSGESRMRLLIQNSPELKFNSDGVNFIELKILETNERLFDSKVAVASGVSGDVSDIDLLIELQRNVNVEDFEIPE